MGASAMTGLPPARQALADHAAEQRAVDDQLRTLRAGKARLESDISAVRGAETELDNLVADEARTLSERVKSGLDWVIGSVTGPKAQRLAEQVSAAKLRSAVGERALGNIENEIAGLEARVADLQNRKPAYVRAAVSEACEGLREDLSTILASLQAAMIQMSALERHVGIQRLGRVTAVIPDFTWSDGLSETVLLAPEREIKKVEAVIAKFAEALAADPRTPASMLEFPPVDPSPDANTTYHELSPTERRHLDSQNASAPFLN